METPLSTLCYIEHEDSYLMLHRTKKEHDINKDKWIGVGGHFEEGESPDDCLVREVREETGLTLISYHLRGVLTFSTNDWPTEYIFLYTATADVHELPECNEGDLVWVLKSEIDSLNLWEGDRIFFRLLEEREEVFSLKLSYQDDTLISAVLNGIPMDGFPSSGNTGNP